ncbi:hypothetical protein NSK_008685 [Nannochloropsis salina CCMP1776]|uniref:TcmA/NAT10 helicase domain-containing protein n=1 Tax=Nannochloropsis salina CCMP1776 TaxID=1027361 RepID=A0A4D9CTW1_9STRA|nr:hypothetical protein NSK_008685 [Nannochloropsis salina CCMP1776]|eukprot:TFJ80128.1 hypothetical protein NSK_008685 [Nannochloropsis salina CCMP1776]
MGGKGKSIVIVEDKESSDAGAAAADNVQKEQLRPVSYADLHPNISSSPSLPPKLGFCALRLPQQHLSPSLLAALSASLQGGGLLVLLLPNLPSWEHLRASPSPTPGGGRRGQGRAVSALLDGEREACSSLFFQRCLVRLPHCRAAFFLTDRLDILPYSPGLKLPVLPPAPAPASHPDEDDMDLPSLQTSLAPSPVVGPLLSLARSLPQARALLTFWDAASEKESSLLRAGTVVMKGGRKRGKTAALGLGLAGAVAFGFSNVFVTAATPARAQTIFKFLLRGLDALGWEEEKDYEVVVQGGRREGGSEGGRAGGPSMLVVRVNVFRAHRQTVQYLFPEDAARLESAEVLAVDEAAALPEACFRKLLGPYLTFVAVGGGEGGGEGGAGPAAVAAVVRMLQSQAGSSAEEVAREAAAEVRGSQSKKGERQVHEERWRKAAEAVSSLRGGRRVVEVAMEEPVLWGQGDPLETWVGRMVGGGEGGREGGMGLRFGTPAPWECRLFYLEAETLLAGHPVTELMLERVLYVYGAWARGPEGEGGAEVGREGEHWLVLLGPEAEAQGGEGGAPRRAGSRACAGGGRGGGGEGGRGGGAAVGGGASSHTPGRDADGLREKGGAGAGEFLGGKAGRGAVGWEGGREGGGAASAARDLGYWREGKGGVRGGRRSGRTGV